MTIAFLGIRTDVFQKNNYSVVIDCALQDSFEICRKLSYALEFSPTEIGRVSPAQFLDLIVEVLVDIEPKPVAILNYEKLVGSDLRFALELVAALANAISKYREKGKRWSVDLYIGEQKLD